MASKTYETIISVLDKFSAPILGLEDKLAKLGNVGAATQKRLQMSPSEKLWNQLSQHLSGVKEGFAGIGEQIGEMGQRLGDVLPMLSAVGGAASIAGILELTHATAEAAEVLHNFALITGTTMPQFQALDFAAKQVGISTDVLGTAMERLNANVGKAAEGQNKNLTALFRQMGISLRDANGHVKSAAELIPQLESSFEKTKDPALRAAAAMALFGRGGEALLPFLTEGPQKLSELEAQFSKFGYSFSEQDQAGLEQFNDAWKDLTLSVQGVQDEIGAKLAPVLAPLLEDFATFVAQNRDLISLDLADAVKALGDDFNALNLHAAILDIQTFTGEVGALIQRIGGLKDAMIVGGSVIALSYLAPLISLGAAFGKLAFSMAALAVGPVIDLGVSFAGLIPEITNVRDAMAALDLAMDANPLGALILAAGVAAGAAIYLYDHWNDFKLGMITILDDVSGAFDKVFLPLENRIKPVFDAIGNDFAAIFGPIENKLMELETAADKLAKFLHLDQPSNAAAPVFAPRQFHHLARLEPPALLEEDHSDETHGVRHDGGVKILALDTGAIKAASFGAAPPARPAEPLKGRVDVTVSVDGLPEGSQVSAVSSGIAGKPLINTGPNGTMRNHRG